MPPFDKELQEITRVDYTDESKEEECCSRQTGQLTQDKTQNTLRDTISNSQLSAQSINASKNDQITLKADSVSTINNLNDGLPLEDDIDELGQPKYVLLTLSCSRYMAISKSCHATLIKQANFSSKENSPCTRVPHMTRLKWGHLVPIGTHPGFYADYYGAIYMHHKECKPEHLTKIHRESKV